MELPTFTWKQHASHVLWLDQCALRDWAEGREKMKRALNEWGNEKNGDEDYACL